jgi:hypothetical protein
MRNGMAYCLRRHYHVPRALQGGGGGRRGMSIIAQVLPNKKAQNKCEGGKAKGGKYIKW